MGTCSDINRLLQDLYIHAHLEGNFFICFVFVPFVPFPVSVMLSENDHCHQSILLNFIS